MESSKLHQRGLIGLVLAAVACALPGTVATATLKPPVKIQMANGTLAAEHGLEYAGAFEVYVGLPGTITELQIKGDGWTVVSAEFPTVSGPVPAGVLRIPFRARPTNADQPIGLSFRFDGRPVRRSFEIGPARVARNAQRALLRRVDLPGEPRLVTEPDTTSEQQVPLDRGPDARESGTSEARGGAIPLRFTGRFFYEREDGRLVGADNIRVEVMDDDGLASDPLVDEVIWSGRTDQHGNFDSGVVMWDDCDVVGCDEPDIYVHIECDTEIAQVQSSDLDETDYFWWTIDDIIENFTGSEVNFGDLAPAGGNDGAVHIWNSIIRAHRYILERSGINLPIVDVQWPESEDGAYYIPFYEEIHIGPNRTWNEGTHTHEYGHHFMENRSVNPAADYCNGFCDGDGSCDFDEDCPDEGHCSWCPENDHDAFNEGWPDYLGDVLPRDYENHYVFFDDGTPYQPLSPKSYENLDVCCVDDLTYDPIITEGFVAALLVDIHDARQDDHNGDGIRDLLCLGPEEILYVVDVYEPITVNDFIDGFRTEYPQHMARFWSTAFNAGGAAYVANFPADAQPPGVVPYCDSSTHPLGVGGSLPCITIEFDVAPDDVTGTSQYSAVATQNPAGMDPGEDAAAVWGTEDCRLTTIVPTTGLGEWYISIKGQDNDGNWSSQWATFGPFEVIDCDGSGILDVCDIDCNSEGIPGCQVADLCSGAAGTCGTASDCNTNFIPDACDIADGTSEDCNDDGVPDECQPMKRFLAASEGNESRWEVTANWENTQRPVDGDHVCIRDGIPTEYVTYKEDYRLLSSLSCEIDFEIDGAMSPWPELDLDGPSFIDGNLAMSGAATLTNTDDLQVGGVFNWADGILRGNGTTTVAGGMNLTSGSVEIWSPHHLTISGGEVNAGGRLMDLYGSSKLTIGQGVTYTYSGDFRIFGGGYTTTIDIDGTLLRTSGSSDVQVYSFVDNSGLIHNQVGGLALFYGGLHSGDILGDPGTLITLGNSHELLPSSTLTVDDAKFLSGSDSVIRGGVNIADTLTVDGGSWTFTDEANVTSYGQELFVRSGTSRFEAPVAGGSTVFGTVTLGEGTYGGLTYFDTGQPVDINTLSLVNGIIYGADPITINTQFSWLNGSFWNGGPVTCNAPSTVHYTSSARYLYREFRNADYATFLGKFGPSGGGVYNNLESGTVELQGDNTGLSGGNVINAGLVVKTAGAGGAPAELGYSLNNSGLIHVQTGALAMGFHDSVNSGDIVGDPGTTLRFLGSHEMPPGSSLVADDVYISTNTSNIRGDVNITGELNMYSGGTWTFTDEANVTSYGHTVINRAGYLHFEAPVAGPSVDFDTVTVGEGFYGGLPHFDTGQPVNIGTLNLANGSVNGADTITIHDSFTWNSGSIFNGGDMTNNGDATVYYTSGTRNLYRDFYNAGTFTFQVGGIAPSNAEFTNLPGGTVDIQSTGGAFGLSTNSTVYNNGLLVKSSGDVSSIQNHFRNAGVVAIQTGTLELYGGYSLTHQQTAGQTILNGGDLTVSSPGVFEMLGGELLGTGTVTGEVDNSGGKVQPGLSAGTLTIDGDYTQQAGGTLEVEIGGTGQGVDYDWLEVTGTATLAGTLEVTFTGGFVPAPGDAFEVLTAGQVAGVFDQEVFINAPAGVELQVTYTADTVIVESLALLIADCDDDGDVDLTDYACFHDCLAGPGGGLLPDCELFDFNEDNDTDLADFAGFQVSFGP